MNLFQLIASEFSKLAANKAILFSVIGALLVPVIFGGIMLSPDWGPYDNLSNLPVAVVNDDEGAISNGEPMNVGDQLVDSLKAKNSLGFEFVSSEEAMEGLEKNNYYLVIVIPEDFSEKATTVLSSNPTKLELKYIQNEGLNFLASKVTESATVQIREELANKVTTKYVTEMFTSLEEVASGFKEAAEGSTQLAEGTTELLQGTNELNQSVTSKLADISKLANGSKDLKAGTGQLLSNLKGKSGDITKLSNGAKDLHAGTGQLLGSLQGKSGDITKLSDGAKDLQAGTGQLLGSLQGKSGDISKLSDGAKNLQAGTGQLLGSLQGKSSDITKLSEGAQELHVGTIRLKDGTATIMGYLQAAQKGSADLRTAFETKLIPGSKGVSDGTAALEAGAKDLHSGAQELVAGLDQYQKAVPLLQADPNFQRILDGAKTLSAGLGDLSTKASPLAAGAKAISDGLSGDAKAGVVSLNDGLNLIVAGQSDIVKGASDAEAGAKALADGNASVNKGWSDLTKGATELNAGAEQVAAGNASVKNGWTDLTKGATELNAGAQQVAAGNVTVKNGWTELTKGATELNAGAQQVAAGNATVRNGWTELTKGATALNTGASQVYDGNKSVDEGWKTLAEGTTKLNEGVAKVDEGTKQLATGLKEGSEKTGGLNLAEANAAMFASPVEFVGSKVNSYEFYRDSTAPYVVTLGLMVGILIMSLFINFTKPQNVSSVSWFVAKFVKLTSLSIVQAIILSFVVLFGLDIIGESLKVESTGKFILFAVFVSVVFSAIVLFLASLGNFGRWIAIAFIVMQLSITGANLPIDLLPEEYRAGSIFLPFTYTIEGFKSVISLTGNMINVAALSLFFVLFVLLALAVFVIRGRGFTFDKDQQNELSV
ncbi:YhgE/Pip domain-containing protein [Bacillus sp. BGMRC 2118]|nr:YhgE/Pip domain-containing protein [Bacillus sp. BGMRC 2118]